MRLARRLSLTDLAKRRRDVAQDVDLLASGWTPNSRTLAAAPRLEDWREATYPGTDLPCLVGRVVGHPTIGDGPVTTSPIIAQGEGVTQWIRTESRFYVLGAPRPPSVNALERLLAEAEVVPVPASGPAAGDDPLADYPHF